MTALVTSPITVIIVTALWRLAGLDSWLITRVIFVVFWLAFVACVSHLAPLYLLTWALGLLLVCAALNGIKEIGER